MSDSDVLKMKVADLKRELRLRGLPQTGNKTELQERLQSALIDGELSLEDTGGIAEDLLDEDDGLTEDEEQAVLDSPTDESVLISPPKTLEDKLLESPGAATLNLTTQQNKTTQPPKKVVLKRKSSLPKLSTTTATTTAATVGESKASTISDLTKENLIAEKIRKIDVTTDQEQQKKVIKLSELSMKERLEMRAKKFGSTKNESSSGKIIAPISTESEEQQIQMLKKRAERFGCVVSSKIAKIEEQEKLLKRQQRFGATVNNASNTSKEKISLSSTDYAEKARLRLERFKTTPATAAATK